MTKIINNGQIDRNQIFDAFANKVTPTKAIAGVEHVTDLQMDLLIIMFDAMLAANTVQLNETQLSNYNKMKEQWIATKSVDLNSATYEIDYAFNGDGVTTPNGLKKAAREAQKEYKQILKDQGYEF